MKKKSTISDIPSIGMGATIRIGSDSYPVTIIQVTQNGKKIVLQEDEATRTDNNGLSELQEYTYQTNPNGTTHIATLRKDGRYRLQGEQIPVYIGIRRKYYDPSF